MKIILGAVGYMLLWGSGLGTVLGALFGCGLISLSAPGAFYIGLWYGGLFGLAGGVVSGSITGLVAGIVTYVFFNPPRDREQYRSIIAGVCCICGAFVTGIGFGAVLNFEWTFTVIPAVIACLAAGNVGYRFATYYPRDKAKRKNDEKPKRDDALADI